MRSLSANFESLKSQTMWGVEPNERKSSIFYYKTGAFEEIRHDTTDTCDDVCRQLCRLWKIPPLTQLLFGLRVHGKNLWLADCRTLNANDKYEFRIRFKVSESFIIHFSPVVIDLKHFLRAISTQTHFPASSDSEPFRPTSIGQEHLRLLLLASAP